MINTENPYHSIDLTFEMLANLNAITGLKGPLPASLQPYLVGVEEVRGRDIPETAPPEAIRYVVAFPGSQFMKIGIKVEEAVPSITQSDLVARGGLVRVAVEGFSSGSFITKDGGARPYFRAAKIVPVPDGPSTQK